jgi:hypothetical protein
MLPGDGSGAGAGNIPIVADEAVRPLSVGLFLAVFIPTAITFAGGLVTSIIKNVEHAKDLEHLKAVTGELQKSMDALVKTSNPSVTDLATMREQLTDIQNRLPFRRSASKKPGGG